MNQDRIYQVLLAPHISEKATVVAEKHKQFVFRVAPDATKPEIKQAVEHLFKVQVDQVRVVNCGGKTKRSGASYGKRADFRKAYVALKPGFDIDFAGQQ